MGKLHADSSSSNVVGEPSKKQILLILFLASIVSTVLTLITFVVFSQGSAYEPWITIGSVIQFQPTRISLYIICFSLGIYAFYKNWFVNGNIPGNYVFWTILSIALWFGHETLLSILLGNLTPIVAVGYIFTRTLLCFSILLAFISYGERFCDSSASVNRSLAKNSYNIYLVHMLFVYLIQLLLLDWSQLSIYIKFIVVSFFAISFSYAFSRYAIKPFPKFSVTAMIGIFAILSIFASTGW